MDLQAFFQAHPRVALGFSGGVDSSYLLYAGLQCGAQVRPYFVKTVFQPEFELEDAKRLAAQLQVPLTIIPLDVLSHPEIAANPADRCYPCKTAIFRALRDQALRDGVDTLIDGTNASDDAGDRPGMRALGELSVLSPLRLCGITKAQVRALSREAGLFTWDKPAYACLATRIPTGTAIDAEMLARVEGAEDALRAMGFTDFRVRVMDGRARLQLPAGQMQEALARREPILTALRPFFAEVLLDLEAR